MLTRKEVTLAIQNRAPHDTKFRDENLPGWFGYMRVVWGGKRMRPVGRRGGR